MLGRIALIGVPIAALVAAAAMALHAALEVRDPNPRFVGRAACVECHAEQETAWRTSHHARSMAPASEEAVRGDFADKSVTAAGVTARFMRKGDRFLVSVAGPEGPPSEREVRYAFGWQPVQQYLAEAPGGRLEVLPFAWETGRKRWVSTGPSPAWNSACADCHSTHVQRNYDFASDTYATTWSEVEVSCEACHGPGGAHVKATSTWLGRQVAPSDLGLRGERHLDGCAPCHARREEVLPGYRHGKPFLEHFVPEPLREDLYHADGQARGEAYEYGSFAQSKMFAKGVRCVDCHDPHTAKRIRPDNRTCTHCHEAARYDGPTHHYHMEGAGSLCVDCHMPEYTVLGVDHRRDHGFRRPRPDLTLSTGAPNACSQCHSERGPEWAAEVVGRWYGAERKEAEPFSIAFAKARRGDADAAAALAAVALDAARPAVVRATALDLLRSRGVEDSRRAFLGSLSSPDPWIRIAAVRGWEALPPGERVRPLAPLLSDANPIVRVEAARLLDPVADQVPADRRRALSAAVVDLARSLGERMEDPAALRALAWMQVRRGEWREAEACVARLPGSDPDTAALRRLVAARGTR